MNLFILSNSKEESAVFHTDKHIVKMPTELSQMLSFAYHHSNLWKHNNPEFIMQFSKTHDLHPCSKWMRESLSNWIYSCEFGLELYKEYQFRFNKPDKHQRAKKIFEFSLNNPPNIKDIGLTPFVCAMPDEVKISDCAVSNYRNYYTKSKTHLFKWTARNKPYWIY
jgi:hypothetical protein